MKGFKYNAAQLIVMKTLIDYLYNAERRSARDVSEIIAKTSQAIGAETPLTPADAFKAILGPSKDLSTLTNSFLANTFETLGYRLVGDLYTGTIEPIQSPVNATVNA